MAANLAVICTLMIQAAANPWGKSSQCAPSTYRPSSASPANCVRKTFSPAYSSYTYTVQTSTRLATPLASPLELTTTYGPPPSEASALLPASLTYTSYSLDRDAVTVSDGEYGQGAYARLWADIKCPTTVPFTTTVSPTPIPTSELVYPPPLYSSCAGSDACLDCYTLPKDFVWGVAGSAYQIEGGLTYGGRGPSVLDTTGALPNTENVTNGEITDMNYFLYKVDIARLAAIGIPYYSFSIPWTRILPFGVPGSPVNTPGLEHYDDLINTCLEYGITPTVTLQHFDNPLNITLSDEQYPDAFLHYSKIVIARYGDRVSHWFTLNEPNIAFGEYTGTAWSAATNILMAHAKVYHWYKETYGGSGLVSTKFANNLALPLDGANPSDQAVASRYQDFILGVMGNPIFRGMNYPEVVLNTPNLNLTALTDEELGYINGTADFWAFDPYTSQFATSPPMGVEACAANSSDPLYPTCAVLTNVQSNGWLMGQPSNAYSYVAPQYVRQQFGYVWNTFRPSGIMVTEFGLPPLNDAENPVVYQLSSYDQSRYYQGFLSEMLKAMYEDNVNVIGTLAWSFADNDEFSTFDEHYGLQHVNRTDGKWTRTYKRSIFDYVDFFHQHIEE